MVKDPLGELNILWILVNLPKNYLDMKNIRFSTADADFEFTVDDGNVSTTIKMTNYLVEVER